MLDISNCFLGSSLSGEAVDVTIIYPFLIIILWIYDFNKFLIFLIVFEGGDADVTLNCEGEVIKAHSFVLGMRFNKTYFCESDIDEGVKSESKHS